MAPLSAEVPDATSDDPYAALSWSKPIEFKFPTVIFLPTRIISAILGITLAFFYFFLIFFERVIIIDFRYDCPAMVVWSDKWWQRWSHLIIYSLTPVLNSLYLFLSHHPTVDRSTIHVARYCVESIKRPLCPSDKSIKAVGPFNGECLRVAGKFRYPAAMRVSLYTNVLILFSSSSICSFFFQVKMVLQVHPEFRGVAEEFRETQCRVKGNASFPMYNVTDPVRSIRVSLANR